MNLTPSWIVLAVCRSVCVDSGALAKRYLTETGSLWVAALLDPPGDYR